MAQINRPSDYFNTVLYTGNSSTQSITGVGFQPDWTWLKARSESASHEIFDAVRGVTKTINSNTDNAEATQADSLTAFDSDGFTLGSNGDLNYSASTYVGWNWLANGAGSANTDGDIASTVSANTTSGFSIVSYTGNGTTSQTIGHGLGVAPRMIIIKNRDASAGWRVYHQSLGVNGSNPNYLQLNETASVELGDSGNFASVPTSSVFGVGNYNVVNGSSNGMLAYCFAEKKGYSKFGSYTGNGSADGTFVYTGFKPAFVMIKRSSGSDHWLMNDSTRSTNENNNTLKANSSDAEYTGTDYGIDLLSNGFKLYTSDGNYNANGNTYIYMCFAENGLVGTNGVPATAR